jgi:hypothetical protein
LNISRGANIRMRTQISIVGQTDEDGKTEIDKSIHKRKTLQMKQILLYLFSSGNQVDGLPLAPSSSEDPQIVKSEIFYEQRDSKSADATIRCGVINRRHCEVLLHIYIYIYIHTHT